MRWMDSSPCSHYSLMLTGWASGAAIKKIFMDMEALTKIIGV